MADADADCIKCSTWKEDKKAVLFNPWWLKFSSKVIKNANTSWLGHLQTFWLHLSRIPSGWECGCWLTGAAKGRWPFFSLDLSHTETHQPVGCWFIWSLFVILELSLLLHRFGVFFFCYVFTHEAWVYPPVQLQSETVRDWFHAVGVAKCTLTVGSSWRSYSAPLTLLMHDGAQHIRVTAPLLIHGFVFDQTASIQSAILLIWLWASGEQNHQTITISHKCL